jgi:folate-dependent phosphoribosylglycinamide formyltransferase PurN
MRIVIFTVENAEFAPLVLGPVLERRGSEVVAAFVSRSLFSGGWIKKRVGFLIRNRYPFCIRLGDWARYARRTVGGRRGTVLGYLRERGIPAEYLDEIRSEATRARLSRLDADVFVFLLFDKIAGPKFLSLPRLGTFNLHMGKLPEHRGGLSAFWVLRFGDDEAGATLHRAVPELDAGEIVAEVRLPVRTKSMHELMTATFSAAGPLVVRALDRIEAGHWPPVDTAGRPTGYYYIPTREDFRAFYARGCRLI